MLAAQNLNTRGHTHTQHWENKKTSNYLQGATLPPCWQLAQEINKKFHKPLTVQNRSIINQRHTISIYYYITFIEAQLLGENL